MHLPLVVILVIWVVDFWMVFPEESRIGVALIEASLLYEETFALWSEVSAPVPMIFGAIGLLQLSSRLNGAVRTTSLVLPGVAFGESIRLGARGILVIIVQ